MKFYKLFLFVLDFFATAGLCLANTIQLQAPTGIIIPDSLVQTMRFPRTIYNSGMGGMIHQPTTQPLPTQLTSALSSSSSPSSPSSASSASLTSATPQSMPSAHTSTSSSHTKSPQTSPASATPAAPTDGGGASPSYLFSISPAYSSKRISQSYSFPAALPSATYSSAAISPSLIFSAPIDGSQVHSEAAHGVGGAAAASLTPVSSSSASSRVHRSYASPSNVPAPPCPSNYLFSCQPSMKPVPCAPSSLPPPAQGGAYSHYIPQYAVPMVREVY